MMASQQLPVSPPIDYYDNGPGIVASAAILAVLATIVVAARFWARKLTRNPLGLDDYLTLLALLLHHASAAADFATVFGGGLGQDFRLVEAKGPSTIAFLFKALLAGEVTYGFSSPTIKLAVLALLWRIFPTKRIKIGGLVLAAIVISWTIAIQIVNFLQCRPLKAFWQLELQSLPGTQCLDFILYFLGNSIVNTVIDFATLVLPIQEILKLQMQTSKKLAVCCIFLLGGIAFAASLLRTISTAVIHNQGVTNFTKQFVVSGVATVVEVYVAIIGSCIPVLAPVYYRLRFGKGFNPSASEGSAKRTPLAGGSGTDSRKGTLGTSQRSYNQIQDDDLSTLINDSSARYIEIQGWDSLRPGHTSEMAIPLQGIKVDQSMKWSESRQSASK